MELFGLPLTSRLEYTDYKSYWNTDMPEFGVTFFDDHRVMVTLPLAAGMGKSADEALRSAAERQASLIHQQYVMVGGRRIGVDTPKGRARAVEAMRAAGLESVPVNGGDFARKMYADGLFG